MTYQHNQLHYTLMRCEILDMWKVSTETTTPSWSRKPATTRGTPGRKDWAHHFSNLNLRITKMSKLEMKYPADRMSWKMLIMWHFTDLPVEVAALFGCADLCRGLQLDVARRRSWSTGVFIPTVHLTREQESVICEPSLDHSAEGLISVNHSAWVWYTVDVI